jgi:hypothetical protein
MVSPRKSRRKSACFSSTRHPQPRTCEQVTEHHPRRSAARDDAVALDRRHAAIMAL